VLSAIRQMLERVPGAIQELQRPRLEKIVFWGFAGAAVLVLLAGALLSHQAALSIRQVVVDQFGSEQLNIARNISDRIERELGVLKRELRLLGERLEAGEGLSPADVEPQVQACFQRVLEIGVQNIQVIDPGAGRRLTFVPFGHWSEAADPGAGAGAIPASALEVSRAEAGATGLMLQMVQRVGARALVFNVNVSWFLNPVVKDIRSGRTGYAWIIDDRGIFLAHPNAEFVGRDAFRIRAKAAPGVSYAIIDFIQKEKMLKAQEGTGWYDSGWHRGHTGQTRKLIAYTPVTVGDEPPQRWSVAVIAPLAEVESAVAAGFQRQMMLLGVVLAAVVLVAAVLLVFEVRWSRRLKRIVERRTRELRRSEEQYRSLVESAEDFIFTVDRDGVFQSVNSFTATFFGGSPGEFVGRNVSSVFPDDAARQTMKLIELVYAHGKSIRQELAIPVGDLVTWIGANFMPIKADDGGILSALCIARDITENKNLERQLINTEKLASLGTLAAGVAHEINNPLGVILGFCDILVRKAEPGSQAHEDLRTIERQGLHCKEIVENLLSFARFGGERHESADLNVCLSDILKVVRHSLEIKRVEVVTDLHAGLPPVRGDTRQLQQVFLNLINNAYAAVPEGGRIHIRTGLEKGGQRVLAVFQDNGPGIRREHMDRIFEPFFTTKPEGQGTGLGLFVSYGIIARYGGNLDCVSPVPDGAPEAGARFTIRLPIFSPEEAQ
jgi:two-component system NtrC family sensor kinase